MTAREAVDIISSLLGEYGQGGPCSEEPGWTDFAYQNSFLIADHTEAWVLETAGQHWVAEQIKGKFFHSHDSIHISTELAFIIFY